MPETTQVFRDSLQEVFDYLSAQDPKVWIYIAVTEILGYNERELVWEGNRER